VRAPNGWTGTETVTFTVTDPDGNSDSDAASFTVTTADEAGQQAGPGTGVYEGGDPLSLGVPSTPELFGNYPNPFNPATTIRYGLPSDQWVTLKIYDALGQEVATLVDGFRTAGYHSAIWNGTLQTGNRASSGVYVYRLQTGEVVKTGRMLLTK
jgi:hypothetical protein